MHEAEAARLDDDPRARALAAKLFWWKGPDEALADRRIGAVVNGVWLPTILPAASRGATSS